jgi:hypothetical protein
LIMDSPKTPSNIFGKRVSISIRMLNMPHAKTFRRD